jgi:hypothetical protein
VSCPKCKSDNVVPIASNWLLTQPDLPLWHCKNCKHEWGKSTSERSDAEIIDRQIEAYLKKHPDDKNRLLAFIKKYQR